MSNRASRGWIGLAMAFVGAGCGGAPAPVTATAPVAAAAASGKADDSPAGRCLALAGAKRERKAGEPAKIGVRHLVVKYQGAKRAEASVTRSRGDACLRALEARDALRSNADLLQTIAKYSDEPGAATRGGSIGSVERKDVAPAFADAAFELGIGEFSDVVETEFGFHVISRSE